ncbi:MAG: RelA/SpoT domain-containing protein [Deltaproteobacteria bacterium]|nr:RelA/SpoT domain-containing protein [Deltaproteobacteria bacterium]
MTEPSSLASIYKSEMGLYRRFGAALGRELQAIVEQAGVTLAVPLEHRIKTLDSIQGKTRRKDRGWTDPKEVSDLIGARIILLFRSEVDEVVKRIEKSLDVVDHEDTGGRLSDSEFGYQSVHIQVKVPSEWLKLPTMTGFDELGAEIQVRTAAQHIWAVTSHKFQYKQESSVPVSLKRSINRAAALLETVDVEFERLLLSRAEYRRALAEPQKEDRRILDVESLRAVLGEVWPEQNREDDEDYAELLAQLVSADLTSREELVRLLSEQKEQALVEDARRAADELRFMYEGSPLKPERSIEQLESNIFYTHVGLTRVALSQAGRLLAAF